MVRLRRCATSHFEKIKVVSIPLWCDCDVICQQLGYFCNAVSIPLWCDCDQGDIKLLKCLASVNGLSLFRLYFTTFFPFCQIGKVGKVANFAANLRLPLRPWGVDGKRSKRKVGGIFGKFGLR
jgi:hypothetical protein